MTKGGKHRERELAFQILYGLSFSPVANEAELAEAFRRSPHNPRNGSEPEGFAWELVRGVRKREAELNAAIGRFSRNWRPDRIGRIETLILRLALYELLHTRAPAKVVISESLELANEFGVESAASFINGILDAAARARPGLLAGGATANGE